MRQNLKYKLPISFPGAIISNETPFIAVKTHKEATIPALRYMWSKSIILVIVNIVENQERCIGRTAKRTLI